MAELFNYFCALTFFRTILNVLPIARPFLAPFEGALAAKADLWRESVLGFCYSHGGDSTGSSQLSIGA